MTYVILDICNGVSNNPDKALLDFIIFILIDNDFFVVYVVVFID